MLSVFFWVVSRELAFPFLMVAPGQTKAARSQLDSNLEAFEIVTSNPSPRAVRRKIESDRLPTRCVEGWGNVAKIDSSAGVRDER